MNLELTQFHKRRPVSGDTFDPWAVERASVDTGQPGAPDTPRFSPKRRPGCSQLTSRRFRCCRSRRFQPLFVFANLFFCTSLLWRICSSNMNSETALITWPRLIGKNTQLSELYRTLQRCAYLRLQVCDEMVSLWKIFKMQAFFNV